MGDKDIRLPEMARRDKCQCPDFASAFGAERTLVSHPRGLVSEFTPEFQTLPLVFIQRFSIPSCAGGFFVTERFISFGSSRPYICFIVLTCIRCLIVRLIIASSRSMRAKSSSNVSRSRISMNSSAPSQRVSGFHRARPSPILEPPCHRIRAFLQRPTREEDV